MIWEIPFVKPPLRKKEKPEEQPTSWRNNSHVKFRPAWESMPLLLLSRSIKSWNIPIFAQDKNVQWNKVNDHFVPSLMIRKYHTTNELITVIISYPSIFFWRDAPRLSIPSLQSRDHPQLNYPILSKAEFSYPCPLKPYLCRIYCK